MKTEYFRKFDGAKIVRFHPVVEYQGEDIRFLCDICISKTTILTEFLWVVGLRKTSYKKVCISHVLISWNDIYNIEIVPTVKIECGKGLPDQYKT